MDTTSSGAWISIADAAILLKVKPAAVLRRIEKGTLQARRSIDLPFTYDGKENYEVRLDALPQRLQYQYLYSHLPKSDICSLDLISPRSVLGNVWLDEYLDITSLIRDVTVIRQQHHGTGHITDELRKLADHHGISLATLYRLTGKPSCESISALYTDPFYLRNHLPTTMCLWSCDLAFALYLDSENKYSQNDIMLEFDKLRSSIPCTDCPYHSAKSDGTDIPKCPTPHEHMPVPNHRKTINRLLHHIPPQMILYARKGYREWRAQYGLFVMRDRPLLVNESWQGDHHKFDLFVRITIRTEHNGKAYEKEIAVRPTLTAWIDSATSTFVGWVISVTPNSDTIAEAFCRAAVLKPGSPIRGLPKKAIVDCGKDYKSRLLEDIPAELASWTPDETEFNKRFAGLGLLPALGVEVAHSLPYHPQSKPIERCFGIIEEKWISKLPGWCRNSIHERPEDFQKTLASLLSDRRLLTLEEFVHHFQNVIIPEYHSTVDSETTVPELPGWTLSVKSMTPLQRYRFLEKAKTITPDWSAINILKLHHSSDHKVGRWGIRFSNTYYQADELAAIVGNKVDILFHHVQPPYAPSSLTVLYQNRYLCEAYPAERRHMYGDAPSEIVQDSDRHNRPAREMKAAITRIRQSAEAMIPNKARSTPSEKNQLSDMVFAPTVEDDITYTEDDNSKIQSPSALSHRNDIRKGLSFLFGEE